MSTNVEIGSAITTLSDIRKQAHGLATGLTLHAPGKADRPGKNQEDKSTNASEYLFKVAEVAHAALEKCGELLPGNESNSEPKP